MSAAKRRHPLLLAIELVVLLALLVGAAWLLRQGYRRYMEAAYPLRYSDTVEAAAADNGLPPSLLYAIIHTESGFRSDNISPAGAIGLMQITPDTFRWAQSRHPDRTDLATDRLLDPQVNITFGAYVLHLLGEQFSDGDVILAAYNAGQGKAREWLANPAYSADGVRLDTIPYPETAAYIQKVRAAQTLYQELYGIS